MVETSYDTRVGAYAVLVQEDQVLLALGNEGAEPLWTLPGGGVHLHESPEVGLEREVREETGYDVAPEALLLAAVDVIPGEHRSRAVPLRRVRLVYTARVLGGSLTSEVSGTTDEARWFPVDAVPALPRIELVDTALDMILRLSVVRRG